MPSLLRRAAASLLALVALAGCASQPAAPGPDSEEAYAATTLTPEPARETERDRLEVHALDALVATSAVQRIKVYRSRDAEEPFAEFHHPGPFGTPRVFLVQRAYPKWLRVLVPVRPNETEGWIKSNHVQLSANPYRLEIDLGDLELEAYRRERMVFRHSVAIGTASTPTPSGLFYTTILARPSDPESPYGKYAMGLSGFSEVLTTFAGGEGQIAIHGTNQPSLIGTPASHGCIRVDNPAITRLAKMLPLGTPVRIHP